MNTPVEVFDDWAKLTGQRRRFHPIPADIAAPFRDQLAVFNRRLHELEPLFLPNRRIDVYLDFIDDGTCDAGAGIWGEQTNGTVCNQIGLVSINKGAILLPLEMFYRMFSHPRVLPNVGDSTEERIGPQHTEGNPDDYNELLKRRRKAGRSQLPKPPTDRTRAAVAQACNDIVWSFVMLHELVHILHGHVKYLWKPSADLDFQTVELWADSKAISVVLRGLLRSDVPLFPDPAQKVFIWSFAMFTLFRIWPLRINPDSLRKHKHPPSALRFEMAMHSAAADIVAICPEIKDIMWDAIHDGQREAERGIVYSGGEPLLAEDIIGTRDPKVASYCDLLMERFEEMLLPRIQSEGLALVSLDAQQGATDA